MKKLLIVFCLLLLPLAAFADDYDDWKPEINHAEVYSGCYAYTEEDDMSSYYIMDVLITGWEKEEWVMLDIRPDGTGYMVVYNRYDSEYSNTRSITSAPITWEGKGDDISIIGEHFGGVFSLTDWHGSSWYEYNEHAVKQISTPYALQARLSGEWKLASVQENGVYKNPAGYAQKLIMGQDYTFTLSDAESPVSQAYMVRDAQVMMGFANQVAELQMSEDLSTIAYTLDGVTYTYSRDGVWVADTEAASSLAGTYWSGEFHDGFDNEVRLGIYFRENGTALMHQQKFGEYEYGWIQPIECTWNGNEQRATIYFKEDGIDQQYKFQRETGAVYALNDTILMLREDLGSIMPRLLGQWQLTGCRVNGGTEVLGADQFDAYNQFRGARVLYDTTYDFGSGFTGTESYLNQDGVPCSYTNSFLIYGGDVYFNNAQLMLDEEGSSMSLTNWTGELFFGRTSEKVEWPSLECEKVKIESSLYNQQQPPEVDPGMDEPALDLPSATQMPAADEAYFEYDVLPDGTVTVIKYNGWSLDVTIPATLGGRTVTALGHSLFANAEGLISVKVPDTVTTIGKGTFAGCKALEEIQLPQGLTAIGMNAFLDCDSLVEITIPGGVEIIGNSSFYSCDNLTTVVLEDGVGSIDNYAFGKCPVLSRVQIPASVTEIGLSVFDKNPGLTFVVAPESVAEQYAQWNGIDRTYIADDTASAESGFEYEVQSDGTIRITRYTGSAAEVEIPLSLDGYIVTDIDSYCFVGCSHVTSITLPNSIESLAGNPFSECAALESIHVSPGNPGLSVIDGALVENDDLFFGKILISYPRRAGTTVYTVPEDVNYIAPWAFSGCEQLTQIILPSSVNRIGYHTFSYCTGLTSMEIPDGVTFIDSSAFEGCSSLTSVTIPSSVEEIDWWAFANCTSLEKLFIPVSVTDIEEEAFWGCSQLTVQVLPGSVAEEYCITYGQRYSVMQPENADADDPALQDYEFEVLGDGTISITKYTGSQSEVDIPATIGGWPVSAIGEQAFYQNGALTRVRIPEGVVSIGKHAFLSCPELQRAELPASLQAIKDGAFSYCSKLTGVVLPDGLTELGENAFSNCPGLTQINIPLGIRQILRGTFSNCLGLTEIVIPEGVESIDIHAFSWCTNLQRVSLPASLTSLNEYAFSGCHKKLKFTVPEGSHAEQFLAGINASLNVVSTEAGAPVSTPVPTTAPTLVPAPAQTYAAVTPMPQSTAVPAASTGRKPIEGVEGAYENVASYAEANSYLTSYSSDYSGAMVVDGVEMTCWQFSTKNIKLGSVTLDIDLQPGSTVDEMWIKNGFWYINQGLDQYTRNGRPKQIGVSFLYDGEKEFRDEMILTLRDDKERRDWQVVPLGRHEHVSCVRIRVISIYTGTKFKTDVAISEVKFVEREGGTSIVYEELKRGSKGDAVVAMKERLQQLGYFKAGAELSGSYNDTCVERVKQFQKRNGLPQTGVADQQTLMLLYSDAALPKN